MLYSRDQPGTHRRQYFYPWVWTQVDAELFLIFFGRFRFRSPTLFSIWITRSLHSPVSPLSSSFTEARFRFPSFVNSPRDWRTKQETKKPFVASSPGEHLTTHSASPAESNKWSPPIDISFVESNEHTYRTSPQGYPVGANSAIPGISERA